MAKGMYPGMNSTEQETGNPPTKVFDGGSEHMAGNEMVGIKSSGYIEKKGTPSGLDARFNMLPPGMNIEDQKNVDIREEPLKNFKGGLSYPGDGWT